MQVHDTFLYLLMERDFHASRTFSGLLTTVSVLSCLPLFWYADPLIKRYGHYSLIVVSEMTCLVRLWIVYMIPPHYDTVLVLVLCSQMLHGLTFALFWAAAVDLMSELSPPGMKNGCMASLNMLYYTVGGAIGSFGWGAVDTHFNGGMATMYEIGTDSISCRVMSTDHVAAPAIPNNTHTYTHTHTHTHTLIYHTCSNQPFLAWWS